MGQLINLHEEYLSSQSTETTSRYCTGNVCQQTDKMLISDIINDGIGLLSKQLKFYCWHYKRDLDSKQTQDLIDLLDEHYFEKLAFKIKLLLQSNIDDCKQQIGKLLFERCLAGHRRNQLMQLIESDLLDINVRLDNYGRTLLHRTAYNLDVELVKLLINHGIDIRLRDYAGNTALHVAIQSYRNGALVYNNEPEVVLNLTSIIELLLEADKGLQLQSALRKRIKLDNENGSNEKVNQSYSLEVNQSQANHKICQVDQQPQQSAIQGQKINLVTHHDSLPNNNTICRIMGSNCICRTQNHGTQKSNNQIDEITIDSHSKKLELPKLGASTMKTNPANIQSECLSGPSSPLLLEEDPTVSLVDTKNAFGRTALHYCVLVVGEQHLDHFVSLLIAHGANVNATDIRLKTPLFCLVKRPGVSAIRQKCRAIVKLVENGCDDLGLALEQPGALFNDDFLKSIESNVAEALSKTTDEQVEPIFLRTSFRRVPTLKHLARLSLIRINDAMNGRLKRQTGILLPHSIPSSLNSFVNRRILDQCELF